MIVERKSKKKTLTKVSFPKDCKYVKLAEVQHSYRESIAYTRKCAVQRARREKRWIDCEIRPSRLVSGIYAWSNR